MARRFWLTATTVVLFGLQAPLCALACLDSTTGLSLTGELPAAVAEASAPPCHEATSESPQSGAPPDEDCGCELAYEAVLPGAPDATSAAPGFAFVPPSTLLRLASASAYVPFSVPKLTDLPPPDLLLLKSTLLI